jgi:hypothetical protein
MKGQENRLLEGHGIKGGILGMIWKVREIRNEFEFRNLSSFQTMRREVHQFLSASGIQGHPPGSQPMIAHPAARMKIMRGKDSMGLK